MLFRKITLSDKEKNETPLQPQPVSAEGAPVYILGDTALACFLAVKLITAGHRVIVLAGPKENTSLSTNGITVKEDYQLQKLHSKIETALWLKETPELLIIASRSSRTKAMLTAVSKNKIKNCPVISFTRMKDKNFISDILGVPVISAYFEGWLSDKNQIVTAYGRNPEIILCAETGSAAYQTMENCLPTRASVSVPTAFLCRHFGTALPFTPPVRFSAPLPAKAFSTSPKTKNCGSSCKRC